MIRVNPEIKVYFQAIKHQSTTLKYMKVKYNVKGLKRLIQSLCFYCIYVYSNNNPGMFTDFVKIIFPKILKYIMMINLLYYLIYRY